MSAIKPTILKKLGLAVVGVALGVAVGSSVGAFDGFIGYNSKEINDVDADAIIQNGKEYAVQTGSEDQVRVLSDGVVTVDEYALAIESTLDCLVSEGFEITSVEPDWTGMMYDYEVKSIGDKNGMYDHCYNLHAAAIDSTYQMLHADEVSKVVEDIVECMAAEGIEKRDLVDENGVAKHPIILQTEHGFDVWDECAKNAQAELTDQLPSITVG